MKVDRRSFLSLLIGGAAGTALSPLPWKLTDDLSIWTQNWPWTPVPQRGESYYETTTCTLCPGGCGIKVRKIDERCVKIEGADDHPVNKGGICLLGLSGLQLLYGPTRVRTPLKRAGERGAGKWEPISWDQALTELADKLRQVRANGAPEKVAWLLDSSQGTVAHLVKRLMTVYGSPNFFTMPSMEDAYKAALKLTQAVDAQVGFDLENADFVLSFGCGLLDGWGSPVRVFKAHSTWHENQATVVQIEPRLSNTAAKADHWLAIKPGSEAELALAMANVIVARNLHHSEFVNGFCENFEGLKRLLALHTPEAAATATGLDPEVIVQWAVKFARASRPVALYGRGQGRTAAGSLKECISIMLLNALVGAVNRAGGMWTVPQYDYIGWEEPELDDVARAGLDRPRADGAGSGKYALASSLVQRLLGGESEPLPEILMVARCNPLYSLPESTLVKKNFDKIPFVVSFSSFMDETAASADLVLPEPVYLERLEDVPVLAGLSLPLIGLCQPVTESQWDTKPLGDVVIALAKKIGDTTASAFQWDDYETCLKETLADKWEALEEQGFWYDARFRPSAWDAGQGKFRLAGGKIDEVLQADEIVPAGDPAKFPLVLVPYDSIRLANDYIGDPPFMIKAVGDDVLKGKDVCVQINPATAKKFALSAGSVVKLVTPVGKARVRVHLDEAVMPGILAVPRGLGHTAYDAYLAGKGINVNALIGSLEDPASGFDAAWGIRAKLAKA